MSSIFAKNGKKLENFGNLSRRNAVLRFILTLCDKNLCVHLIAAKFAQISNRFLIFR